MNKIPPISLVAKKTHQLLEEKYAKGDNKDSRLLGEKLFQHNLMETDEQKSQETLFINEFEDYQTKNLQYNTKNQANPNSNKELAPKFLLAKIITPDDLETLASYYVENHELFEKLAKNIEQAPNGTENALLNEVMQQYQLNKAQIYLCLVYVLEYLQKKNSKREFCRQLEKEFIKYQSEQAQYIINFFNILKNPKLSNQIKKTQIDLLSDLAANNKPRPIDLKETIKYIIETFQDNWQGIVSIYVKVHARQLKQLTKIELSPEDRVHLIELLKMEIKLQVVYSLLIQIDNFIQELARHNLKINISTAHTLLSLLSLSETAFFAEVHLITWLNSCGLTNLEVDKYLICLNCLLARLSVFPEQVFENDKEKFKNMINVLKLIIQNKKDLSRNTQQNSYFLKNRKTNLKIYR